MFVLAATRGVAETPLVVPLLPLICSLFETHSSFCARRSQWCTRHLGFMHAGVPTNVPQTGCANALHLPPCHPLPLPIPFSVRLGMPSIPMPPLTSFWNTTRSSLSSCPTVCQGLISAAPALWHFIGQPPGPTSRLIIVQARSDTAHHS